VFTLFHKPPYTYPYGRSLDETTTEGSSTNKVWLGRAFFAKMY
jgi:hypothetical protein